jgi:hypothetical protein
MTRGTECKCSSIKVNGLIQVRQDTSVLKSGMEIAGNVIKRHGLIRMTKGTDCKCSSVEVNDLIQVRQVSSLLKFCLETAGKVVERR